MRRPEEIEMKIEEARSTKHYSEQMNEAYDAGVVRALEWVLEHIDDLNVGET